MDNYRLNEITYILEHIRREDKEELIALYGKSWKKKTISDLKKSEMRVLYGYNFKGQYVPVAAGGIERVDCDIPGIACVWLLTTRYIYKNKRGLVKILKDEFQKADKKYDLLYNFIHKSNFKAKNWLKKFGFNFERRLNFDIPENFEFFYKLTKGSKICV